MIDREVEINLEGKLQLELAPLLLTLATIDLIEVIIDGCLTVLP